MTRAGRLAAGLLFAAALVAGSATDGRRSSPSLVLGGYHVLAADFHVHMFPLGWSTLSPWDTVIEARHQGLDVIAMVPHNLVWPGKVGRWFSNLIGGPMVITGEEITAPDYHLLAVGVEETISARLPIVGATGAVLRRSLLEMTSLVHRSIDEVHHSDRLHLRACALRSKKPVRCTLKRKTAVSLP